MFTKERHEKIIELLNNKNSVSVTELEALFDVSSETIRRDLLTLESKKQLIRVHGGAMSIVKNITDKSFEVRHKEYRTEKTELAVCATSFINEGDTIVIDSGSTVIFLCEEILKKFHNLTVITNSLMVFEMLEKHAGFHLILIGGDFYPDGRSFVGSMAVESIKKLHASKAFVAPVGISLKFGLTDFSSASVEVQRAFISIADKVFIIGDSSKFEVSATYRLGYLTEDMTLICDSNLNEDIYQKYLDADIDIVR